MKVDKSSIKRVAIALLSAVATALSIIMVRHSLEGAELIGCSAGSSCDAVMGSRWSMLLGLIPVSGLALGVYIALFICNIFTSARYEAGIRELSYKLMCLLCGAMVGSAVWFIVLQRWIVMSFCVYCMSAHACGVVIAVIVLSYMDGKKVAGRWIYAGVGVLMAAAVAVTQIVTTPKNTFLEGASQEALPTAYQPGTPTIGSADAGHVITVLFDYQCSHCRRLHILLEQVAQDGEYAFLMCPSPISPACNPYIPHTGEDVFEGSCELAKLALALWTIDHEKYYEYDSWLFDSGRPNSIWRPRRVHDAESKAIELVGEEALNTALASDAVAIAISTNIELFGRTTSDGKSAIPRLILGDRWIIPQVESAEELLEVIRSTFVE